MYHFLSTLAPATPHFDVEGYDAYIGRDATGSYWYIIDTDDFTGPEPSIVIDPCSFGPDPA